MDKKERLQKALETDRRKKEREDVQNLNAKGFKQVQEYKGLFVNELGTVYNCKKGKELKRNAKNTVSVNGKRVNVAKMILSAFKAEPIRKNDHITHIDGNRSNLNPENVKYSNKFGKGLKTNVNAEKLKTAIRCYFEVSVKYNVKDSVLTRMYLTEIVRKRHFYYNYSTTVGVETFKNYMQGFKNNIVRVAKKQGISIRDCREIVHKFINMLISDILADLQAGNLTIQDFAPRPKTKTQVIKEVNEYITENGGKPLPLRRKSNKEILKDYQRKINEMFNN